MLDPDTVLQSDLEQLMPTKYFEDDLPGDINAATQDDNWQQDSGQPNELFHDEWPDMIYLMPAESD